MNRIILFAILILISFLSLANAQDLETSFNIYTSDEDVLESLLRSASQANNTVQGFIRDSNNNPIPSVQVMLIGNNNVLSTYTNDNGLYQFFNVVGGTGYTIIPTQYEPTEIIDNSQVSGNTIVSIAQKEVGNTDGTSPGRYHGHGGGGAANLYHGPIGRLEIHLQVVTMMEGHVMKIGICLRYIV